MGHIFGEGGGRAAGVVLVHASDTTMLSWFPFAKRLLNAGYAVLTVDLRGYGQSAGPRSAGGYDDDVAGAIEILHLFEVDNIAVVGAEAGGTAAVVGAVRRPQFVRAIATVGSGPQFESLDARESARSIDVPMLVFTNGEDGGRELASLAPDAEVRNLDQAAEPQVTENQDLWRQLEELFSSRLR